MSVLGGGPRILFWLGWHVEGSYLFFKHFGLRRHAVRSNLVRLGRSVGTRRRNQGIFGSLILSCLFKTLLKSFGKDFPESTLGSC